MKILKKTITIAIILMLCITLKVYAGEIKANLTTTSTNVKVGETVTVTLSGYHGNGVEGFDAVLKYDKTKLKLINEEQIAATNYTTASGVDELTKEFILSVMYSGSGKGPVEATLAQLKFEVLDGAKVNDTLNIKLTEANLIDSTDSNDNVYKLDDIEINLKVVEEQKDPGENNTTPGGNNTTPGGNNATPGGNNDSKPGEYPYAGLENHMFIIIFVTGIISIAIYIKANKYRGIK